MAADPGSGHTSLVDEVTDLALRGARGDEAALADLIRRTQADVWRYCAHLNGPHEADDLTQEVYLRAIRALPSFRGEAPVRTWLLTIARRTCADHVRAQVRRRRLGDELERREQQRATPAESDHAGAHGLESLIAELPDDQRSAFTLTQVLGLSYAETASVCGCPVGTVRSRVARAREAVISALADAEAIPGDGTADI